MPDATSKPANANDPATRGQQILQQVWGAQIDSQTTQQLTGLIAVRQARVNLVQRQATAFRRSGLYNPGWQGVLSRPCASEPRPLGSSPGRSGARQPASGTQLKNERTYGFKIRSCF